MLRIGDRLINIMQVAHASYQKPRGAAGIPSLLLVFLSGEPLTLSGHEATAFWDILRDLYEDPKASGLQKIPAMRGLS